MLQQYIAQPKMRAETELTKPKTCHLCPGVTSEPIGWTDNHLTPSLIRTTLLLTPKYQHITAYCVESIEEETERSRQTARLPS